MKVEKIEIEETKTDYDIICDAVETLKNGQALKVSDVNISTVRSYIYNRMKGKYSIKKIDENSCYIIKKNGGT